jgi:thiol-disulfide isomerase/thioredoxin
MKKKAILFVAAIAVVGTMGWMTADNDTKTITNPEEQIAVLNVGDKAPDLKFKDPSGKDRALSSLKGKLVLIDFWASWCGPCRQENPNVVKVYNQYKNSRFKNGKGFEVFSVSLDQNKGAWVAAIEKDGLVWENHVSDLQYWRSEGARIYNVNSIPATFLVDGEGVIIAKNLRGQALERTLASLVTK